MPFKINEFAASVKFGLARRNLFMVELTNPITNVADGQFSFRCQAAGLPESQLREIEVPYMGRNIKVAGNRTFAAWQATITEDEDWIVRDALETWHSAI